jgi:hypothetical protein
MSYPLPTLLWQEGAHGFSEEIPAQLRRKAQALRVTVVLAMAAKARLLAVPVD